MKSLVVAVLCLNLALCHALPVEKVTLESVDAAATGDSVTANERVTRYGRYGGFGGGFGGFPGGGYGGYPGGGYGGFPGGVYGGFPGGGYGGGGYPGGGFLGFPGGGFGNALSQASASANSFGSGYG